MSIFGSLTLEQVFVNLCRARAAANPQYSIVNQAMEGGLMPDEDVGELDVGELVREEHMELVQNVAEEMGVQNVDDPEVYGQLLNLNCDHCEQLGRFIEETSE